jgi:hypothetical protein
MAFVEVFIVLLVCRFYRYFCCCCQKVDEDQNYSTTRNEESCHDKHNTDDRMSHNISSLHFSATFTSQFGRPGQYILLFTRLISLGYMFGNDVVNYYVIEGRNGWFWFTIWNVELISVYFFLAVACSIIGLVYGNKISEPYTAATNYRNDHGDAEGGSIDQYYARLYWFARIVQAFFEVAGGTAFFVTVVAFTLLNPSFDFWNASVHFATSMFMLAELFLNNIPVRVDHCSINVCWALLYLIFIWPLTVLRTSPLSYWPYSFLDTRTPYCFFQYTLLIVLNVIFYLIWYGFYALKVHLYSKLFTDSAARDGKERNGSQANQYRSTVV